MRFFALLRSLFPLSSLLADAFRSSDYFDARRATLVFLRKYFVPWQFVDVVLVEMVDSTFVVHNVSHVLDEPPVSLLDFRISTLFVLERGAFT